jgi:bacillithiol system protein YtxJ
MIKDLETRHDFDNLLANSLTEPVLLLKHSTRCPISSAAWRAYQSYATAHPGAALYRVLVVEHREVSQEIAQQTGIAHQSPQALLFAGRQVTWHASHYSITADALEAAMVQAARK